MMTLKDIKDWLKKQVSADVWKIGTYDARKEKTICIRNLASNRNKVAIGGLSQTSTKVKGISIVIHWTNNPDETERIAQKIYELFYAQQPNINGFQVVKNDMRNDEPVAVGSDAQGIYEYVIELWCTYMKER